MRFEQQTQKTKGIQNVRNTSLKYSSVCTTFKIKLTFARMSQKQIKKAQNLTSYAFLSKNFLPMMGSLNLRENEW
jgi:hypothetical protein